jgi:hypothetical protein
MTQILFASAIALLMLSGAATAADRATVAEQVAAKCRKDYPDPDYVTQLGCRQMQMEAFDKLEQEDQQNKKGRQR